MSHKLDIGICSYRNPEKLKRALDSIMNNTRTPCLVHVWHNKSEDAENGAALAVAQFKSDRITESPNVGYAGAVNGLIAASTAPYFAYCDNDVEILTPGWDERFIEVLENNPECGLVFPGAGHYGFHNGRYHECLWNAGYCWMIRRDVLESLAVHEGHTLGLNRDNSWPMDSELGHHEEVDLATRLRFSGYQIGCCPDVQVLHHETATSSPASEDRIHKGVVSWMERWNRHFVGDQIKYPNPERSSGEGYDPRTLRYTDWNIHALYLERFTLHHFPEWNANPRTVEVPGVGKMDAIEVLKPHGFYKGRAL